MSAEDAFEAANAAFAAGDAAAAAAGYRAFLARDPASSRAWQNLGVALSSLGEPVASGRCITRALRIDPHYEIALRNLVEAHRRAGDLAATTAAAMAWLERHPADGDMLLLLGGMLLEARKRLPAAHILMRAARAAPSDAELLLKVADALGRIGLNAEAIRCCRAGVALDPGPEPRFLLARLLERDDQIPEALALLDELHAELPDNGVIAHTRDSLSGRPSTDRAPEDYVRKLFDSSAADFDQHLVGRLQYRAHEVVAAVAAGRLQAPATVVDAGCGTGLVAERLKPLGHRLVGVDLSPGMLARAKERGVYDELYQADLVTFLEALDPGSVDAVLAADVLCYFGDLRPFVAATARALKPGGFAAFTLEEAPGDGWRLTGSGRYAHGIGHVRAAARDLLVVAGLGHEGLRFEAGRPVRGLLCILARQGAGARTALEARPSEA